jgi:uncharacterized alkaline shock family protein YloU
MANLMQPDSLLHAPAGRVEVAATAIAAMAAAAALATPGIAALTLPGARAQPLPLAQAARGVEVALRNGLALELFVLVRSGAAIVPTAAAAQEQVRAAIERALGDAPEQVRIRVQGLR